LNTVPRIFAETMVAAGYCCKSVGYLRARSRECKQKPATEPVQALADISRSALCAFAVYRAISLHRCVVTAMKPVLRSRIRQTVQN